MLVSCAFSQTMHWWVKLISFIRDVNTLTTSKQKVSCESLKRAFELVVPAVHTSNIVFLLLYVELFGSGSQTVWSSVGPMRQIMPTVSTKHVGRQKLLEPSCSSGTSQYENCLKIFAHTGNVDSAIDAGGRVTEPNHPWFAEVTDLILTPETSTGVIPIWGSDHWA